MKELPDGFNGTVPVENRYNFTNLNQCTYRWELVNFNKPGSYMAGSKMGKFGSVLAPNILPTEKGSLKIDLPSDWKKYDALVLSAADPFKNELYSWTWKIKSNTALLDSVLTIAGKEAVAVTENDSLLTLKASGIAVSISKTNGKLVKIMNDFSGRPLSFTNGPVLVSGNTTFTGLKHYKTDDGYAADCSFTGSLKKMQWKMHPTGWLELAYEYELNGTYPFTGVSFSYPENYVFGAKWLGAGPYRVWKNRQFGTPLNVWQNAYNNTQTGAAPWLYPEFKGYFGNIVWLQMDTAEGKFTIATKEDDLFVRLFDFQGLSGPKPSPAVPVGDISFLDRIPPMGGKLAFGISNNTTALGPLSEPNKVNGLTKRTLYFYFGTPKSAGENKQFTMPKENILTDEKAGQGF